MKLPRRQFLNLAAGAVVLPTISRIARAQTYPARPITIVVPFAVGGTLDVLARIFSERMRVSLGQPIIVENIAGASGSTGVGRVARAAPDGYTINLGYSGTHVLNGATYALPYDVVTDFEPIILLGSNPQLIVVRNSVPAKDLTEFIAWLKTNPDKASQGTTGAGSPPHVSGVLFQNVTKTRFQFVPYRGAAPELQDLVGGQIDLMIDNATNSLPQVRAGTIRALAVTARSRLASAPDIPTVDEAGLPGFYASLWYALFAPRGTPENVIEKLNNAATAALAEPAVRNRLVELGLDAPATNIQTPKALRALQKAEIEKWWPIIKAAGIKAE